MKISFVESDAFFLFSNFCTSDRLVIKIKDTLYLVRVKKISWPVLALGFSFKISKKLLVKRSDDLPENT